MKDEGLNLATMSGMFADENKARAFLNGLAEFRDASGHATFVRA